MALMQEHEKYHSLGPKDVGMSGDKKQVAVIDVARSTAHTGEQFHVAIPVYGDDTREMLRERVNFFLSIIQDRMEDENKAVAALNERAQKVRAVKESIKRNGHHFQQKLKALEKKARKEKWSEEDFISERTKLVDGLQAANKELLDSLESEEDKKGISTAAPEATEEGPEMSPALASLKENLPEQVQAQ